MSLPRIGVDDVHGVVGILPTPAKDGADSPRAVDTVDLDESARMVDAVAASGVDLILTNGTFGEAATLTLDELLAFNEVVVDTVRGRAPVFAGATTSNTRDTIARGRELLALGVDGFFVGRPLWLPLDDNQLVSFYRAVADAFPGVPLIVYDNAGVFKGPISDAAYAELARIPEIIASKHHGVRAGSDAYERAHAAVAGGLRLLPTLDSWVPTGDAFPGEVLAAWCGDVACGPEPAIALRDAIFSGDRELAKRIQSEISWASETLFPDGDIALFMRYSIQIDRAEFEAAGFIRPGPARHPYTTAPAAYLEGGAEMGRRWASLRARHAVHAVAV